MAIQVTVDGKSVFKDHKQKILAFTFKGGRTFQGEYQSSGAENVEGNIWQAGADADDLLLGVSFVIHKQNQILLNTIQIAKPVPKIGHGKERPPQRARKGREKNSPIIPRS